MTPSINRPTSPQAPKWLSLLLVALSIFTSSAGAIAAPVPADLARPAHVSLVQDDPAPNTDATPAAITAPFGLYLPTLARDRSQVETLEVHVVRLNQTEVQSQNKFEPADAPQAAEGSLLPAPPPGEELYPAQPDPDFPSGAEAITVKSPEGLASTVTLLHEDFEGAFPTGNWRVIDSDGTNNGEYFWDDDDAKSYNGVRSAWVANGGQNGLDPEYYNYPNNLQTWMVYGPFDLSDASSAQLNFSYWNLSEMRYDFFGWYASPNGTDFYGMRASGNSQGWKPVTLDLGAVPVVGNLRGDSSVWIAFRFTSDGRITDRGAFVDQIRVQKEVGANCAGGFKAEYFNNKELSGSPLFTRCEQPPLNHNWGASGPGSGIGHDDFSIRWTGTFDFSSGAYNFVTVADDGMRVWLDNEQIISNWQDQAATPNLATRQVSAGQHTIRVEYYEHDGGALAQFRWLRSDTTVSNRQAFDTCFLPHPSETETWWGNSPYYELGIYIGGNNSGCRVHNQEHLNTSWVSTVRGQGWNLIPTWVGPQAPCTTQNFYTMSSDPEVAFAEGRFEAGEAATAARNLGLTSQDLGGTVIYYDMEPYPNNPECRETVKSFMAGWASRLHELGNQAGAYGAACASYVTDWVLAAPYTVDQIWPAAWIHPAYNPDATVWNVSCLDNSLWSNHQRIRQYAGDHNERWGNITLYIDSNIVDGRVAGRNPRAQVAATERVEESWQSVQITDMQLLAEGSTGGSGWVIAQGQFLWTSDGGTTWLNRTPSEMALDIRAASFLDLNRGWLVAAAQPDTEGRSPLYLGQTEDGGHTWQLRPLTEFNPIEPGSTQGAVELNFFDARNGTLQIKLASSSSFDIHTLLKTVDGGATWQEVAVPGNSPVHFTDAATGWTVSMTSDAAAQITTDGGASWGPIEGSPATAATTGSEQLAAATAAEMGATATTFLDNGIGWIFVEHGLCSGTKPPQQEAEPEIATDAAPFDCIQHNALLSTPDGSTTWLDITPMHD
jgi:hypothetical protein